MSKEKEKSTKGHHYYRTSDAVMDMMDPSSNQIYARDWLDTFYASWEKGINIGLVKAEEKEACGELFDLKQEASQIKERLQKLIRKGVRAVEQIEKLNDYIRKTYAKEIRARKFYKKEDNNIVNVVIRLIEKK